MNLPWRFRFRSVACSTTHQLQVLGRLSFDEACASGGAAHFEILLRRRP
jgi:hypothetical protein